MTTQMNMSVSPVSPPQIKYPKLTIALETITPEKAQEYLDLNNNIRKFAESRIASFVRDMENEAWTVNGESIKFNQMGQMIDGQNRLAACIRAKKPFTTLVVRGVENDKDVDTGQSRSVAQILKGKYELPDGVALAAAMRVIKMIDKDNVSVLGNRMGPNEVMDIFDSLDKELFIWVHEKSRMVNNRGLFVGVCYLFAKKDKDLCEQFIDGYISGAGLNEGHPMIKLRDHYISRKPNYSRIGRATQVSLMIKVWNAMRTGDFPKLLIWKPKVERIPEIV